MQTSKDYLHVFLDMGDALLNSGAEIFRVEDTLNPVSYTHLDVYKRQIASWQYPT